MPYNPVDHILNCSATIADAIQGALRERAQSNGVLIGYDTAAILLQNCGIITNAILMLKSSVEAAAQAEAQPKARSVPNNYMVYDESHRDPDKKKPASHSERILHPEQPLAPETTASVDDIYGEFAQDDESVMQDEGVNLPTAEAMHAAIMRARAINAASKQKQAVAEQQPEVHTGVTGGAPTTRVISAANLIRNAEIAEMARKAQEQQQTASTPVAPTVRPRQVTSGSFTPVQNKPQPTIQEPIAKEAPAAQPTGEITRSGIVVKPAPVQVPMVSSALSDAPKPLRVPVQPPKPVNEQAQLPEEKVVEDIPAESVETNTQASLDESGARPNGYVPAVGAYRNKTAKTLDLKQLFAPIPHEEAKAGATATKQYNPIPGVNIRIPSPYERLTDPRFSVFSEIFAPTSYTPDCGGVVSANAPLDWFQNIRLEELSGKSLVASKQGFYGFNPSNEGPEFVLLRAPTCIVVWNLSHSTNNCRIFYLGRSNITGLWYPPEAMDCLELFNVVSDLAMLGKSLIANVNGEEYTPKAIARI